jgi:hypothetical protein
MAIRVEDKQSPLTAVFGGNTFIVADQAFQLQEPVFRDKLHILLSIDVSCPSVPKIWIFRSVGSANTTRVESSTMASATMPTSFGIQPFWNSPLPVSNTRWVILIRMRRQAEPATTEVACSPNLESSCPHLGSQ